MLSQNISGLHKREVLNEANALTSQHSRFVHSFSEQSIFFGVSRRRVMLFCRRSLRALASLLKTSRTFVLRDAEITVCFFVGNQL